MTLEEARRVADLTARYDMLGNILDALKNGDVLCLSAGGHYYDFSDPDHAKLVVVEMRHSVANALVAEGVDL